MEAVSKYLQAAPLAGMYPIEEFDWLNKKGMGELRARSFNLFSK